MSGWESSSDESQTKVRSHACNCVVYEIPQDIRFVISGEKSGSSCVNGFDTVQFLTWSSLSWGVLVCELWHWTWLIFHYHVLEVTVNDHFTKSFMYIFLFTSSVVHFFMKILSLCLRTTTFAGTISEYVSQGEVFLDLVRCHHKSWCALILWILTIRVGHMRSHKCTINRNLVFQNLMALDPGGFLDEIFCVTRVCVYDGVFTSINSG